MFVYVTKSKSHKALKNNRFISDELYKYRKNLNSERNLWFNLEVIKAEVTLKNNISTFYSRFIKLLNK